MILHKDGRTAAPCRSVTAVKMEKAEQISENRLTGNERSAEGPPLVNCFGIKKRKKGKKMSFVYLGAFPPGWGGVTIKNRDLYAAIKNQGVEIRAIDFNQITRKHRIDVAIELLFAMLNPNNRFIIGISAHSRKKLTKLLYQVNRSAMSRSALVIMGGTAADDIVEDAEYLRYISRYRVIFAETDRMMKKMQEAGLQNVSLYPNCRFQPKKAFYSQAQHEKLKCVFFSLIQPQKGVDLILESAGNLPDIEFSFWGNIDPDYASEFQKKVETMGNVSYNGIFAGENEEVYEELSKYDVLLFPTKWKTEGVPGIMVEAKIAGLTIIASNESHNAELVKDGAEGIILRENTAEALADAISTLNQDRELLQCLKNGSHQSAEMYYIENYISQIISFIQE